MGYHAARQTKGADMADHKHGEMDIRAQEKTFDGFVRFSVRTTVVILVALVFLALVNG